MSRKITDKKRERGLLLEILFSFLFCAASLVFSILLIEGMVGEFWQRNASWLVVVVSLLLSLFYGFTVFLSLTERSSGYRLCISGYILYLFAVILLFVLQQTGFLYVLRSGKLLKEYIQKAGNFKLIVFIILQFLQVILLPIPGFLSTAVGVALFGPFQTMICSFIGVIAGSLFAFWIGRKFGFMAVKWAIGEKELRKWLNKIKGKDYLILTIMFILPLFPDDILCFVSGLSTMSNRYFIWMIIITRLVAIASTCFFVDWIPFNRWWGATIWVLFAVAVVILFIYLYKNLDKLNDWLYKKRRRK